MKKIIFLDVDGTLVDHSQTIPESTIKALAKAKENGHHLVICTGRAYNLMSSDLIQYFDGVIASAGAHIFWGDEELFHSHIPKDALIKASKVLDKFNANYVFNGYAGRVASEKNKNALIKYFSEVGSKDISNSFLPEILENPYEKVCIESGIYINATATIEEIQKEIGDVIKITGASFGTEHVYNGELTLNGINKATGMEKLLTHIGLTREDSIAFGDGPNDFEMIEYAHIGVAMGNAVNDLKTIATLVTDHVNEDGIYNGFSKLGLIN